MKKPLSVHFLFTTKTVIKENYYDLIEIVIRDVANYKEFNFTVEGVSVQSDHIHLLIVDEDSNSDSLDGLKALLISKFITRLAMELSQTMDFMFNAELTLDDGVNAMFFPYSHLRIMKSYLRDQENVHEEITLKEEVESIFNQKEEYSDRDFNGMQGYSYN